MIAVHLHIEVGGGTVARVETIANAGQAETIFARGRRVGIERILDGDTKSVADALAGHGNLAAIGERGDAVFDRVFNERLDEQRRHFEIRADGIEILAHAEALTESNLLNVEIASGEGQLFAKRDARALAEPQGGTQEIRQTNAHFAGLGWIESGEGANGIQAVEEEMRVDLRLDGFELRFARKQLSLARRFDGENDVVDGDSEEIDHVHHTGEGRPGGMKTLAEPREDWTEERGQHVGEYHHDGGRTHGCNHVVDD